MQLHWNAEGAWVTIEEMALVVNVLNAGSEAAIVDYAPNLAGRLDRAASCAHFRS